MATDSIYIRLTREFNKGRVRAVISSGQAVVFYRLAIMSKDGDWIVREDEESLDHILKVLGGHGAKYRFGAPLALSWLSGGWSSHFEFINEGIRIRTDFVSRPPRLSSNDLEEIWEQDAEDDPPVVAIAKLIEIKKTQREKDYPIIGELAKRADTVNAQLLSSRSARDLIELSAQYPVEFQAALKFREVLKTLPLGRDAVEVALDAERRKMMRADETRMKRYGTVSAAWQKMWPQLSQDTSNLPLGEAHRLMVARATEILPFGIEEP